MKKLFTNTFLFILIATLCVGLMSCDFVNDILGNFTSNQEDSNESVDSNNETSEPSESTNNSSNNSSNDTNEPDDYIYSCEAPGYFSNLSDFYKFATSGSRNPEDYAGSYTSENIDWYPNIDANALLKIEDLFNDTDIKDNVEKVFINYEANNYTYVLTSGVTVNVIYAPKSMVIGTITDIVRGDKTEFVQDDDKNRFSIASTDGKIYVKEVNGTTINRQMKKSLDVYYFSFTTLIDEYQVSVETYWADKYNSQDQLLNDPTNQFVKSFLNDSELPNAIDTLKSCIDKNKAQ